MLTGLDHTLPSEFGHRLRFETLVADLAARFVSVPADEVDREIIDALRDLCDCLGVDRSSVWQDSATDPTRVLLTHLYPTPDVPVPIDPDIRDYFPWAWRQLTDGRTIVLSSLAELPPEAARDREVWEQYSTKSVLVFPLAAGGGPVMGLLAFDALRGERQWPEAIVTRCRLIAQVFASALARTRADHALRESEERYRTLAVNLPGVVYQFYARDDGRWGMRYVDGRAAELLGLSPEPLDTFFDRFMARVAPEEREPFLASIRDAVAAVRSWDRETRFLRPTGEEIYLRAFSEPRRIGDEVVFSGVMREVTAQKRAEIELHRTLDELRRLREQLEHENVYLRNEVRAIHGTSPIVGESEALRRVLIEAQQVAAAGSTVLILGETGTGKELLASHLHQIGRRSAKPFITINVAAIPSTLIESELFGREKGAYTGALTKQLGRFELADGGTLFLDEIGEMAIETQAKLLRVLQSGEIERLGGGKTTKVDVHVIAATNRRLPELIAAGRFRQDLYYRLNVFPITLPPLRDRPEDVPMLVWAFVKELSERMGKPVERIRRADLDALKRYPWPGNVRELRNVVERSMIMAQGPELHLVLPEGEGEADADGAGSMRLRDVDRAHVLRVLKRTGGRIRGPAGAAVLLGLQPTTLYSLMERLGIDRKTRTPVDAAPATNP